MNTFIDELKNISNFDYTENYAIKHLTTKSAILDMFALCGSYRNRTDEDCILMFKNAFNEDKTLAMKCLFYLRDIRGGAGERRFFRVCFKWLCDNDSAAAARNLDKIPEFGRWDDLIYSCMGTACEKIALEKIKSQLTADILSMTPSLLAKWLPSENASSPVTKRMANTIRTALGLTHKQYRNILSTLRESINVLEKLMSSNAWDKIDFSKLPSKAGLNYKDAFARREETAERYKEFISSKNTKVNAGTLYPYEIVKKALHYNDETDREVINKYWENQIDVLNGKPCKMLCVCDTSGSMTGTPIHVAIGLSMYCAERIGGAFQNHYISFSSKPQLIKVEGIDFVDKVKRIYRTNLCENTNIEATFNLLKEVALKSNPEDIPEVITIISDMEIDCMTGPFWDYASENNKKWTEESSATEMERIREDWAAAGLKCPRLVYWNVDARHNTILDAGPNVSFVSGFSPIIFKQILTGKTGMELCLETLNSERYACIK